MGGEAQWVRCWCSAATLRVCKGLTLTLTRSVRVCKGHSCRGGHRRGSVAALKVQCGGAEGVQRANPNPNQRCAWEGRRSSSYPRTAAEVSHTAEVAGAGWRGRGRLLAPLGSCESHTSGWPNRSCPKLLQQRPSHNRRCRAPSLLHWRLQFLRVGVLFDQQFPSWEHRVIVVAAAAGTDT